jgi:hypothetical protein
MVHESAKETPKTWRFVRWENGGRGPQNSPDATHQHRMREQLQQQLLAEADPDSWGAVSLKRALSMPGWKASVIAVEAGGHATQQRKHREAAGSGVRWRWCPYKRGRVEASSDITAIDVAPLRKRSNRKHGTAGSAKNTEVVPIAAATGYPHRYATAATIPRMTASPMTAFAIPLRRQHGAPDDATGD